MKKGCLLIGCGAVGGVGLLVLIGIGFGSSHLRSRMEAGQSAETPKPASPPTDAGTPRTPTPKTTARKTGNPTHDTVTGLPEDARRQLFANVLRSTADPCGSITRTFYQGMEKKAKTAFWNIACSNGQSYAISVYADQGGSTKVLSCAVLKKVTKSECFVKFPE